MVGVNRYVDDAVASPPLQRIDSGAEREQVERVRRVRAERDQAAWAAATERLVRVAATDENLMPAIIDAVKARATLGEISDRLRVGLGRAPGAADGLMGMERTFEMIGHAMGGFTRVHHVAVVVGDMDASLGFWRDTLGLPVELVLPIETDRVRIAFLPVGESKIELVEPTDDTTGVARFLASRGEGFHHVCLEVPDIVAVPRASRRRGGRAHRRSAASRRRGPRGLPPPAELPRRAGRADRGARRSGVGGFGPRAVTRWIDLATAEPELAANGRRLFYQYGPGTGFLATVSADGAPRLHPVCPLLTDDGLFVFVVPSQKLRDLQRDGRYALHANLPEEVEEEFLVSGLATEVLDPEIRAKAIAAYHVSNVPDAWHLFELSVDRVLHGTYRFRGDDSPVYRRWRAP